jgi:opacity protein-like surface antigen
MKSLLRLFVLTVAGVALGASLSHAGAFILGGNLGYQSYTGDVGEGWDPALVYGATVDYALNPMWAIGANLGYSVSKHEDDGKDASTIYPGLTGTISDELTNLQFGVNVKFFPFKEWPLNPYVVAGVGSYGLKEEFSTANYSESIDATKTGFRGGAGLQWMLTPMIGVTAEGDYHSVQTEGDATTFYGLRAGVAVKLGTK